jgi:hypothetical protein
MDEVEPARDLASVVVPAVGRLVTSGDPWAPFVLVDPDGVPVEAVDAFLRDLQAAGRSAATARSYGLDLLRWFRFLWALGVSWDRATRAEVRDFCRWLLVAGKPARPHWRRRSPAARPPAAPGRVVLTRPRCGLIARRCCVASTSSTGRRTPGRS